MYKLYGKCACKPHDTYYTDCNEKRDTYWTHNHSIGYVHRGVDTYLSHIEMQLITITKNNKKCIIRLKKLSKQKSIKIKNMEKRIIELENAIKYAPNGEVYNECKKEFEQLIKL
jgi:hypothetical protein